MFARELRSLRRSMSDANPDVSNSRLDVSTSSWLAGLAVLVVGVLLPVFAVARTFFSRPGSKQRSQ